MPRTRPRTLRVTGSAALPESVRSTVRVSSGIVDAVATRDGKRIVIEAKGEDSGGYGSAQMNFQMAFGQISSRMTDVGLRQRKRYQSSAVDEPRSPGLPRQRNETALQVAGVCLGQVRVLAGEHDCAIPEVLPRPARIRPAQGERMAGVSGGHPQPGRGRRRPRGNRPGARGCGEDSRRLSRRLAGPRRAR